MHDDALKPLVLRPRLTIHPEINPELYERLTKIKPELINSLIFQMLVKCSHIEKYLVDYAPYQAPIEDKPRLKRQNVVKHENSKETVKVENVGQKPDAIIGIDNTEEPVVDAKQLKNALTGFQFG